MRDRRFVPFDWKRHWVRAFAVVGSAEPTWDLLPPVKGYRPARSDRRTYYISLGRQHRDWSKAVIDRDGRRCQQCDRTTELQAHHRWPQSWFPHLRYLIRNGTTLCRDCHESADWYSELTPNQFRWVSQDAEQINSNIERDDFWDYFTAGDEKGRLKLFGIETDEIDWNSPKVVNELEWYKQVALPTQYIDRVYESAKKEPVPDPAVRLDEAFIGKIRSATHGWPAMSPTIPRDSLRI
jgi:hypothetical protein